MGSNVRDDSCVGGTPQRASPHSGVGLLSTEGSSISTWRTAALIDMVWLRPGAMRWNWYRGPWSAAYSRSDGPQWWIGATRPVACGSCAPYTRQVSLRGGLTVTEQLRHARRQFIRRGTVPVQALDVQMTAIRGSWGHLSFYAERMVETLRPDGTFRPWEEISEILQLRGRPAEVGPDTESS